MGTDGTRSCGSGGASIGIPFATRGVRHFHPDGSIWTVPAGSDSHRLIRTTMDFDTTLIVETVKPGVVIDPAVRGDEFWAVVIDEFDIPYVVRTRIVPRDSEGR